MAIYKKKDYENFNSGKLTPDGADLGKCSESWNMWQLLGWLSFSTHLRKCWQFCFSKLYVKYAYN